MTFVTNLGFAQPKTNITADNACQRHRYCKNQIRKKYFVCNFYSDCWFKRFVKENIPTDEKKHAVMT